MTVEDIEKRIQRILEIRGDDEAAHSEEDSLYVDILRAIADGAVNPAQLAAAALKTIAIDFERWCA